MENNTAPVPRMKGRFNLYDTPDGGLHIAYQEDYKTADDDGTPIDEPIQHLELPGRLVKLTESLKTGGASPAKLMKAIMSMMGGPE